MKHVAGFHSLSPRRRQGDVNVMWNLMAVLIYVVAIGKTRAEDLATQFPTYTTTWLTTEYDDMLFFNLPSIAITLDIEKDDDVLIPFQDKLTENLESHLEKFYRNKLLTAEIGNPVFMDVDLESRLLWKELSMTPKKQQIEDASSGINAFNYGTVEFLKKYEVRGIFNCKIKLRVEPIVTEDGEKEKLALLNQVLMHVFFLEAFEEDHEWDLLHGFLSNPILHDIINVDIKVMDSGFVHPHDRDGNLVFPKSIDYVKEAKTPTWMLVGIAFVITFGVVLIVVWFCLFILMKGKKRFRFFHLLRNKMCSSIDNNDDDSCKGSSVTGSTSSNDSVCTADPSTMSNINYNLDAWANSITSISLRNPNKRKKRGQKVVKRPYFRPSDEHSSNLSCITEADNESSCSTVKSTGTSRSERSRRKRESKNASLAMSTEHYESPSATSGLSSIIYEEGDVDKDTDADDDNNNKMQSAPLLSDRGLIRLLPSEDEDDYLFSKV
uniref:Uncharacterized protein n=1 Tax=Pseudo-nitzschia australis TaxID=44445 RepID=A0A7S4ER66_9STRA|mmetsp:Transcript_26379/g.57799  ORF Transcript_26379/g.57799 Transcript_26379/m.57799 type:complete len:494 (-) Transcript_26379:97-1578(-)|eukprot:CAMPEP_0168213236 /NCGR_PEP_ID=MMETSP0140_2-20121125/4691_1 /TAXON_ID=44445 /ORGANISM="Pseudo-nitzschia australis, Strain 10249 10 AB" /LENGTH=493 /DNA_ID=CAMNT_0008140081 /DNA_START=24 /DNA_END=1505 /DNA_ORIENTATION=+